MNERARFDGEHRLPSPAAVLAHHATARFAQECPAWISAGPVGHCYANTLRALLDAPAYALRDTIKYTEGYAYNPRFDPLLEQAWLEAADSTVYDPTWADASRCVYIGLQFTEAEILDAYLAFEGSLLFADWERDFSLLHSHTSCCAPMPQARRR